MSYELMFWRQEKMMTQTTELIAAALQRNEPVEGLSPLPIEMFLTKLMSSFPGAVKVAGGEREFIRWMSPNEEDTFKVTWSDQHVLVRCNHLPLGEVNEIVDIAKSFGCPLYDPQTKERFRLVEK
jgi:hypothetical protein